MRPVLIVICHPRPDSFSFSLAEGICDELSAHAIPVLFSDLYAENFDPVLRKDEFDRRFSLEPDIQRRYAELASAGIIVLVHPDWWGQPPALLKGWVDRVFRQGIAYDFSGDEFERKTPVPLLAGKRAFVFCTSDSPARGAHPVVRFWKESVFGYCGAEARVKVFRPVRESGPAMRKRWLALARRTVLEACLPPPR